MEYREFDKKKPPIEVMNLNLRPDQKTYLDPLDVILNEYQDIDGWKAISIHLDDHEKTVIGFAIIGYFGKDKTWIDDIMIDLKYQGKGYGTQAITYLRKYLMDTYDVDHIYLSCYQDNTYALRLYDKLGFKLTNELDINGELILVYDKK